MPQYETMVLLSPNLTDETVEESVQNFSNQVTAGGGEVLKVDRWGKKRLAYPVQRQRHGFYYIVTYKSEPAVVQEIERGMRLNEDTYRYMTIRMDAALLRKLERNEQNAKRQAAMAQEGRRGDDDRGDRDRGDRDRGDRDRGERDRGDRGDRDRGDRDRGDRGDRGRRDED